MRCLANEIIIKVGKVVSKYECENLHLIELMIVVVNPFWDGSKFNTLVIFFEDFSLPKVFMELGPLVTQSSSKCITFGKSLQ